VHLSQPGAVQREAIRLASFASWPDTRHGPIAG